jgi:hypothetical protein
MQQLDLKNNYKDILSSQIAQNDMQKQMNTMERQEAGRM